MGSRAAVAVVVEAVTAGPVSFRGKGPARGLSNRVASPAGCRVRATRWGVWNASSDRYPGICEVETHGACVPPGHAPAGRGHRASRLKTEHEGSGCGFACGVQQPE